MDDILLVDSDADTLVQRSKKKLPHLELWIYSWKTTRRFYQFYQGYSIGLQKSSIIESTNQERSIMNFQWFSKNSGRY